MPRPGRPRNPISIPIIGRDFSLPASSPSVKPIQHPIQWVSGALAAEVKRPGLEADHWPPSSTEVKNDGRWFELSNNSDVPFQWRFRVMYFYCWDNPANLRNREKRGISVRGKSFALMQFGFSLPPCSQELAPFRYPGPPEISSTPSRLFQFHVLPSAFIKTRDAGLLLKNWFFRYRFKVNLFISC